VQQFSIHPTPAQGCYHKKTLNNCTLFASTAVLEWITSYEPAESVLPLPARKRYEYQVAGYYRTGITTSPMEETNASTTPMYCGMMHDGTT
jgi:hypothetical protein